jgi:curved DNA-binding protein
MFVDHYEILQISPNADSETIRRIYKMQAQRFHPDNLESGDAEAFRRVSDAYEILGDPEKRARYDQHHRESKEPTRAAPTVMDEMQRRETILQALYRKRFASPGDASVGLRDFELLLGVRKDELEFSLWYLKELGYLVRNDSARHTITIKGVQFAEALKSGTAKWIE